MKGFPSARFRFAAAGPAGFVAHHAVPLLFLLMCIAGILVARIQPAFLAGEMLARFGRNAVLVLSLLVPVLAGLGLNFGIVLGAMAGQVAVITVIHAGASGLGGLLLAALLATPLAVLFGWLVGALYNRSRGKEMVTGLIAGFFASGVYQLVFLFMIGKLIPFDEPSMVLPQGYGLRNTVDLTVLQYALDDLLPLRVTLAGSSLRVPVATYGFTAACCAGLYLLLRTKLGQDLRAVGLDPHVASVAGIPVDRHRITATILSTVMAAWGQLVFLQNIGTLNTYNSHEQVGMFAIAALLVSGATVRRATVPQALVGTLLFHTLFVVSPLAGKAIAGDAQIGEFFRSFLAYAIITTALVLHAWRKRAA